MVAQLHPPRGTRLEFVLSSSSSSLCFFFSFFYQLFCSTVPDLKVHAGQIFYFNTLEQVKQPETCRNQFVSFLFSRGMSWPYPIILKNK